MLTPPEELENAPARASVRPFADRTHARADARSVRAEARDPEPDPSAFTRSAVRATGSTTVALAARAPGPSATVTVWLALGAATLAAAAILWLLLSSGPL
jgi:hypothetical protein